MSRDGQRAYINNELNTSMTALNLADNTVIARDIESSAPPAPGTQAHRNLVGKLAFFTALGIPDKLDTTGDGQFDVALRDINPLANQRQGVATTPGRAAPRATTTATPTTSPGSSRPARARPFRSKARSRATTSTTSASSTGARCAVRTRTSTTMRAASRAATASRPTSMASTRPRRCSTTARPRASAIRWTR